MGRIKNAVFGRFGAMVAVTAAVSTLALGINAGVARADSFQTIGFGGCYVAKQVCIPRGTFTITTRSVGGSGSELSYVDAGFTYVGEISNLWIDHDFYNASGTLVGHIQGQEKFGTHSVAAQSWTFPSGYAAPVNGKHCATLYSQENGYVKKWVTACETIK
jgi:hypothetical protein